MRFLSLLLPVLLISGILCPLRACGEDTVSCQASLLIETQTGCILAEENGTRHLPIGSLAKLMTAYLAALAIEDGTLSPDMLLTAGNNVTGTKGAVIWLEAGDSITVAELLTGLLAGNANDAAAVLAQHISGSEEAFVMDMNAAAFDLGMRDTVFTSPQGYDDEASHSTARDLGILTCAVLSMPVLHEALTTWRTFIRDNTVEIVNENTLTRTMDGCLGVKAAHSAQAGQCLIAAAEHGELTCAAIVLGCPDETERFTAAKQLLRQGFSAYTTEFTGFSEEFLNPLKIRHGTEASVLLHTDVLPPLAVRKSTPSLQAVLVLPVYAQAPVRKGQLLGEVYFYDGDTLLYSSGLYAGKDVPAVTFRLAAQRVLRYLLT